MNNVKKGNVISGLFWTYSERIAAQTVSLIVSVILARLLDPAHYGIVSIVMIFITLGDVFVTGGFGNALVQKKDAEELDFNTILICSAFVSLVVYILIFVSAPYIADFYNMPTIKAVLRVLGLRIPIAGFNSIQHARIQRKMAFKQFFTATLFGTIISAIIGIVMAYKGFGEWSLVAQYLSNTIIDTLILYFIDDWKPKLMFSMQRARELMTYGWKVLATTLIYTLEGDIRSLIIGKQFGSGDLAFYDQGRKFPNLFVANICTSINKVIFPTMSSVQDDSIRIKQMSRTAIQVGTFLLTPLLIGLIAVADNFVKIVFTSKWLPCVPYLRILTIVYLVRPMTTTCQQAILAIGKSDIILRIEAVLNIIALSLVCIAVFYFKSVLLIAVGSVITEMVSISIFMYFMKKLVQYLYKEQIKDIVPSIMLSCIMGIMVYSISFFIMASTPVLFLTQIIMGVIIYIGGALLFRISGCIYLLKIIEQKMPDCAFHKILYSYLYLHS